MLLFACHAWITASYILLCQKPYCLRLSPPPDQLWGSAADRAPSSTPLSLVCAPDFSSLPARSCLFTSLKLPSPLCSAPSFLLSHSLLLTICLSLLHQSRQSALLCKRLATWSPGQQFLPLLCHLTVPEPFQIFISTTAGCSSTRIDPLPPPFTFPFPSLVLISCPLTLTLLFSAPAHPLVFALTPSLFPPIIHFTLLTMLPCVCWLQLILILLSSVLWTRGENCPATCLCPDPHTVDCTGRGLTRLPDEIPLDVRRLLLADNWIPRIPSDFLVLYSDLVYLDLRNNSLSHIEPGTLSTSSRLVFLDLGSNNLTEIPKGTFGESRSLIKLRLGNNPYLSMVNEEAFLGLTSLRELELERNALSTLKVGALSQLPSLRVVRLEGNPWVCNCNFASLFAWLMENSHKLPNGKQHHQKLSMCLTQIMRIWAHHTTASWQIHCHNTTLVYLCFPCRRGKPPPSPLF